MSIISTLKETQEFATLPPVASRVLKLLDDDNVDVREIAAVIEADVSLTLKLLRVANSPLYASRNEIDSIHQAIITLGLNRLTNIVLGISIFSRFLLSSQKQAAELMEKFWWHSSCTGMVSKALSRKIGKNFKEIEFIGGLLHEIGKLAMLQIDTAKYSEVVRLVEEEGMLDSEAEKKVFEMSHEEVGAEIARLWRLPADLSNIITFHSEPALAPNSNDLIAVVRLADLFCEIWGAGFYEGIKALDIGREESWGILCDHYPELRELDLEVFTFELEEEFKKSAAFLNILVQESVSD